MRRSAIVLAVLLAAGVAHADELAFLGPRGTYSEQAADQYSNRVRGFDKTVPMDTITAVWRVVQDGRIQRGIIPAVATTSGFPAESTRVLLGALDPGVRIVGEQTIPIDNDLMVKPGTTLERIKTVLSHPNALGEAGHWLHANLPHAAWQETKSTAAAAEIVSTGDGTTAAVAGPFAAKYYGLDVLAEKIQDNQQNATSFWAIVRAGAPMEDTPDRIAVNLEAPAGSAAFSAVVSELASAGLQVVNVNSVPLAGELLGYRYMIVLAAGKQLVLGPIEGLIRARAAASGGTALVIGAWRTGHSG